MSNLPIKAILLVLSVNTLHAANVDYTGVTGGEWATGNNWSNGSFPANGDTAFLNTTANLSIDAPNNIQAIRIGEDGNGRLQIGSQATLSATSNSGAISQIGSGNGNQGYVQQEGGTVDINILEIGSNSSAGTYHIHSGSLNIARDRQSNSLFLGTDVNKTGTGDGTFTISSGSVTTRAGVYLGSPSGGIGRFEVIGSHPGVIGIGSSGSLDGIWTQNAGSILSARIDRTPQGITPIFVDDRGQSGGGDGDVIFQNGALLDVGFSGAFLNGGTFTVMEWEGDVTNNGLRFASSVDTSIWSFRVDTRNKRLTVTAAGNPMARSFVHPGLAHKLSDLERMREMVAAGIEPYATTFAQLSSHPRARYTVQPGTLSDQEREVLDSRTNSFLANDGISAYYNALMWMITGDSRHADASVRIFNAWSSLRRNTQAVPLSSGRHWRLIEAAEIIKSTYPGWSPSDLQDFKDMLVYPGYSNTTTPTQAINNSDVTLYWRCFQGDSVRHGNQGLFCMRMVMAMGVFLDNEIMYDRALRYLQGAPSRADDIPYPSGPPIAEQQIGAFEHFNEFRRTGEESTVQDYGYNEAIHNYIWPNGQGQESSRDQAHALAGTTIICTMAEMAWNQGDNLYGHLDNRPLRGLEHYLRYNLSLDYPFSDQPNPWEPTVESGEFIQRLDRSGRWFSLKINPFIAQNVGPEFFERGKHTFQPVYEMHLAHYRDRLGLPGEETKWLERGLDILTDEIGVEPEGTIGDYPTRGGLTFHRVSPGDPVEGFTDGRPNFAMNTLPTTIEAENYDYFPIDGEGRTYRDLSAGNSGLSYRPVDGVDISPASEGGFGLTSIEAGEWVTYTVAVPTAGQYGIAIRYAASRSGGRIRFSFDDTDLTGEIDVPSSNSNWRDLVISPGVALSQGVKSMKVQFSGASNAFELNSITVADPFLPFVVSTTKSNTAPTMSNSDLAQTQYLSSSATGGEEASAHATLFNGSIGNGDRDTNDNGEVRLNSGNTVTVNFDTSVNSGGYDLTGITTLFGWNTSAGGRSNQGYAIILGYVDGSTETLAGPQHWEPNNPASFWTTVSFTPGEGGVLASGVKSVTFDITNDANPGGWIVAREFDIFGVPTLGEGLVARWAMDESSGSTVADSSGQGFAATQSNATRVSGVSGNALSFNGSRSTVALPAAAFGSVENEITVAAWVYGAANQPRNDSMFFAVDSNGNRVLNIHLPWSNGQVYWDAGYQGGTDRINRTASANEYRGQWNHWAFSKNASSGTMSIYLNGELWHSGTNKTRPMSGITAAAFGSQLGGLYYSGTLDDVRLYNVSLNESEVSDLFESYVLVNGVPASWLLSFGIDPTDVGALADTDGDGLANWEEYRAGSNPLVGDGSPGLRVTEYYVTTGDFSGTQATISLDQSLADDYYILVRGSRTGSGLSLPDNDYARVTGVPSGSSRYPGEMSNSSNASSITLRRADDAFDWEGVVTVVECTNPASSSGFRLVDVLSTDLSGTSGTDSSESWSDLDQVVLFGGYRGGGASFVGTPTSRNQGTSVYTRLFPSGNRTLNWSRDAGGETLVDAEMTTFVVEWGAGWNVQHVNVAGSSGGNGANAASEYTTAGISSVNRGNTWIWGTGTRSDAGIGDSAEACLVTLGNGVNQNTNEDTVAVGSEYTDAYSFDVYTLTHPDLAVDHRFKSDGDTGASDLAVTVDSATSGARMGWVYNGVNGTGTYFSRPRMWARYTANNEVTISRGFSGQNFPAWVQGIDFSEVND